MANNLIKKDRLIYENVSSFTVQHNLDSENIFFSIIIDGEVKTDIIEEVRPKRGDERNAFVVKLKQFTPSLALQVYTKDILPANFMNSKLRDIAQVGDENIYKSFFRKVLVENSQYSNGQIANGFISSIYASEDDLPQTPAKPSLPTFAMISEMTSPGAKLAYWDYYSQSGWTVTEYPWISPQFEPLFVVSKDFEPVGNNTWDYTMGSIYRAKVAGAIVNGSIYLGPGGGSTHTWQLRKSTLTQSGRPALSTFTQILEQGVVSMQSPSSWTDLSMQSEHAVEENEWYMLIFCVFEGGTSFNIDSARTSSDLNEDIMALEGGCYIPLAGIPPGVPVLPDKFFKKTSYGCTNLQVK